MPTLLYVVLAVLIFITGAVIGSFLNVVAYRVPKKESLIKGRSHCTTCGKQIENRDLIPIVSWLWLRGKCRSCGEKISPRYMIVEALTGALYLTAFFICGISVELAFAAVLFPVLVVASLSDIDKGEIPYWCSITVGVLGIVSIFTDTMPWYEHLIGAASIGILFAILAFLGAMGGGDLQLMAAAGLLLGYRIIPAAAVGFIVGAVGGIISKIKTKNSEIRFGPYLSAGIVFGYLFGTNVIDFYVGLIR